MTNLATVAAEPTLDELLRRTKTERTEADYMAIVKLYRERRAALLAKKEGHDSTDEPAVTEE